MTERDTEAKQRAWRMLFGCNGVCVSAADVGVGSSDQIAYPHPDCPEHGDPGSACVPCRGWGSFEGDYSTLQGMADARMCGECGGSGFSPKM